MKYSDISKTEEVDKSISYFKTGKADSRIEVYKAEYGISDKRLVMDKSKRPDKQIKNEAGEVVRTELVNRIPVPLQKRIVGSTVSFTFGNPVELTTESSTAPGKTILGAVRRILADSKIDSFNRRVARDLARCTEVAECWFPVSVDTHDHYGFSTPFKIKVQQFSPWNGDELYPIYDQTGNMIAFGRGFSRLQETKKVQYFEIYTDEEKIVWEGGDGATWSELSREENVVGKIPVVYARQDEVEWHDVEQMINRVEKLLSNFGDTNDYFGSPILSITGEVRGLSEKGQQGKVFQMENGAEAEFLSWDNAPEAIKLEAETLLRFIYSLTQTPDISFDSVKGLKEISGEALKMLFLDAHLKVQEKREVFDEYLQRRVNILKAFVGVLNTALKGEAAKMEIVPHIVPFTITSEKDLIDRLTAANGGKPLISQKTAIMLAGLVDDVDAEYDLLQEETARDRTFDIGEPTV